MRSYIDYLFEKVWGPCYPHIEIRWQGSEWNGPEQGIFLRFANLQPKLTREAASTAWFFVISSGQLISATLCLPLRLAQGGFQLYLVDE